MRQSAASSAMGSLETFAAFRTNDDSGGAGVVTSLSHLQGGAINSWLLFARLRQSGAAPKALATEAPKAQADPSAKSILPWQRGRAGAILVSSSLARIRSYLRSLATQQTRIDARCWGSSRPNARDLHAQRAGHLATTFATKILLATRKCQVTLPPTDYSHRHVRTPVDAHSVHQRRGSNGQS